MGGNDEKMHEAFAGKMFVYIDALKAYKLDSDISTEKQRMLDVKSRCESYLEIKKDVDNLVNAAKASHTIPKGTILTDVDILNIKELPKAPDVNDDVKYTTNCWWGRRVATNASLTISEIPGPETWSEKAAGIYADKLIEASIVKLAKCMHDDGEDAKFCTRIGQVISNLLIVANIHGIKVGHTIEKEMSKYMRDIIISDEILQRKERV